MKFRSLYSRVALIFATLMLLFGGLCTGLDLIAARHHQKEIIQRLSSGLASHIADNWPLTAAGGIDKNAINELFHMLMIVNPSIELYLLDDQGAIIAFDAPAGRVRLTQVAMEPIHDFLAGGDLPLRGDNPRRPERQEVFSAAPLRHDGKTVGYLYIVLAGDEYYQLAENVWHGHVFQSALWAGLGALLLTLVVGLGLFFLVTRRLDALTQSIAALGDSDFSGTLQLDHTIQGSTDEIGRLAATFMRMAECIRIQMQQIRSQDDQRREMVANVSHDLRTPLTSMQGYLETMQRKSGQLTREEQQLYLDIAVRQSRRVAHLAQELFDLAKLEFDGVQPNFEPFPVQDLIQDVVQKFDLAARARNILITADIHERIPLVYADIEMIERVLTNLIDNALRYTPEGGHIELTLFRDDADKVKVRVKDNGSGIADEYLSSLFDRDSPLRKAPQKRLGGGLGLLITRRILQLHGCAIEALSGQGRGAVFTFSLPTAMPT